MTSFTEWTKGEQQSKIDLSTPTCWIFDGMRMTIIYLEPIVDFHPKKILLTKDP